MPLDYEEFIKIIPKHTLDYLKTAFKYYEMDDNSIVYVKTEDKFENFASIIEREPIEYDYTKVLLSLTLALDDYTEYFPLLGKYGYNSSKVYCKDFDEDEELCHDESVLFGEFSKFILRYNDKLRYEELSPLDIYNNVLNGCHEFKNNYTERNLVISRFLKMNKLFDDAVYTAMVDYKNEQNLKEEYKLYEGMTYETIKYIEKSEFIRTCLIDYLSEKDNLSKSIFRNDDSDLVPLSLLLAIFFTDTEDCNLVKEYLENLGFDIDKFIKNNLNNISFNENDYIKSINTIKKLYMPYIDKKNNKIKTFDVIEKLFDRNFTHSLSVEKSLNLFNIKKENLLDIKNKINIMKDTRGEKEVKKLFKDLNKDTRDFIIFATKVYQVLYKLFDENKINKNLVSSINDLDTLSIYIASCYFNASISKFYASYGVTFDKVMNLLNISLNKEDIEKEKLNNKVLIDRFERFILGGYNYERKKSEVIIDDVCHNLCSRTFNKSTIMEDILEEIRRDIDLPSDFRSLFDTFLRQEKERENKRKIEEYFGEDSIGFLAFAKIAYYKYHENYMANYLNSKYDDELNIFLSLLSTILIRDKNGNLLCKMGQYLQALGINKTMLGLNFNNVYYDFDDYAKVDSCFNIDRFIEKFDKYIHGGRNKDKKDITIMDVGFNLFNKELFDSSIIKNELSRLKLSYKDFDDTEKIKEKAEIIMEEDRLKKLQEQKNREFSTIIAKKSQGIRKLFKATNYVYNILIGYIKGNEEKYPKIKSEEDIEIISFLLAVLDNRIINQFELFNEQDIIMKTEWSLEKYGVTDNRILDYYGIPKDYSALKLLEVSQDTLANNFMKYLDYDKVNGGFPNILDKDCFKDLISNISTNKERLNRELLTGKSYEESLSLNERIDLLKDIEVSIDTNDNLSDIINSTKDLDIHAGYIQDEYPKIIQDDSIEKSTKEIQTLVNSAYEVVEVEEEPKGVFQKLFGPLPTNRKEVKLNLEVVNSLKPNIELQIKKLLDEAKKLNELKDYLNEYRKKNNEYILLLNEKLKLVEESLSNIDKENIFEISDYKSYISVLKNKIETLKLTDALLKQEYIKLNQIIVNHCIVINSLMLSRNTLLPLISSQVMIRDGLDKEKEGIEITAQMLTLLNDIISQDNEKAASVLESLKASKMTDGELSLLTSSINSQIEENNELKNSLKSFEEKLDEPSGELKLTL